MESHGKGYRIHIAASRVLEGTQIGDSIAVNGACLTVVKLTDKTFTVEAVKETVDRTALANLNQKPVNLERALQAKDRFGGHFVQGHVDGTAQVVSITKQDPGYWLTLQLSPEIQQFMVEKGSIAVNGISLTIAALEGDTLSIAVIPHTVNATTLNQLKPGEWVNIEADILAKYIYKMLNNRRETKGITPETLEKYGF